MRRESGFSLVLISSNAGLSNFTLNAGKRFGLQDKSERHAAWIAGALTLDSLVILIRKKICRLEKRALSPSLRLNCRELVLVL
jgi:hypothetical protein